VDKLVQEAREENKENDLKHLGVKSELSLFLPAFSFGQLKWL
jgi:hypothetical protein